MTCQSMRSIVETSVSPTSPILSSSMSNSLRMKGMAPLKTDLLSWTPAVRLQASVSPTTTTPPLGSPSRLMTSMRSPSEMASRKEPLLTTTSLRLTMLLVASTLINQLETMLMAPTSVAQALWHVSTLVWTFTLATCLAE